MCAITMAGKAYCWGSNQFGQIGDNGNTGLRLVPTAVAGGHVFIQIDAGFQHTCAVTSTHMGVLSARRRRIR
jgi:alpha-tubulin suppressor-like RCC1 family protein